MDVWGITVATVRRWYVFLPILAIAAVLAYGAGQQAHPEYEATGSAMMTPPRPDPELPNPFVNAQGANSAISIILNGSDTQERVAAQGLKSTFTVSPTSRSPIFRVVATGGDAEDVVATIDAVIKVAAEELAARQKAAGIKPEYYIGLEVLSPPYLSAVDNNTAVRVQAVILGLGVVLAVVVAILFDDIVGLVRRRRSKAREARAAEAEGAEADVAAAKPDPEADTDAESVDDAPEAEPDDSVPAEDDSSDEAPAEAEDTVAAPDAKQLRQR